MTGEGARRLPWQQGVRTTSMTRLRLTNSHPDPVHFSLEPWGEEYLMAPGATFEIVARGPEGGTLEVESASERVTVWGWAGSTVTLARDGISLGPDVRTPVPIGSGWSEQPAERVGEPSVAAPGT
jgi:hypothetical protein